MDATTSTRTGSKPNCARRYMEDDAATQLKPAKLRAPRIPLDEERQALAAQWRQLAYKEARAHIRRLPRLADEIESAATWGLVKAASLYDPATGNAFSTFAVYCIRTEILNALRADRPQGYRTADRDARPTVEGLGICDPPTPTVANATDDREIVGIILERVGPKLAHILRQRHFEGKTLEAIGEELGFSKQRIKQLEARAHEVARRHLSNIVRAG